MPALLDRCASLVRGLITRRRAGREPDDGLRFHLFDSTWQDARHAARALLRDPAVSTSAVAMLALAIGITTAMFTVVDAVVLRPVPFPDANQLAFVYMGDEHGGRLSVSPAVLRAWQQSPAFAGAESADSETALVTAANDVSVKGVARVTPGIFDLLGGVRPIRGRLFSATEVAAGLDDRVLISEEVWRSLYQADPGIVGRTVTIDGESLVVIGVLPSEFRFPSWDTVVWRTETFNSPRAREAGRRAIVCVRFAPQLRRTEAVRMATDAAHTADPATARLWMRVNPLIDEVLDPYYARALPVLSGAVVLVFLVLCGNTCSLLLARSTARRSEFAMRSALGASRLRLVRQAMAESAVLGALGLLAGIGIAWTLVTLSRSFLPEAFLLRTLNPLGIDRRALAVTCGFGVVATLLAGLLPAWIGTRRDGDSPLRKADRGGTGPRGARTTLQALLVGEIALACALLVGASLLVRSFVNLARADRGLDVAGVLVATMNLDAKVVPDRASREAATRSIEEQVARIPGVEQVAWSYGVPPEGGATSFGEWRSDAPGAPVVNMDVNRYYVATEFLRLYGLSLLRGRWFQPGEHGGSVVVGERFARTMWPGLDPIGRSFTFETEQAPLRVVGLVREIHFPSLEARLDRPQFYHPFSGVLNLGMLSIRCGPACPGAASIRQKVAAAHPGVRNLTVRALESEYFEQLARPRAAAALGFVFGAVAVLAAAGGLFSVLSYAVGRRMREFGIRAALGASPGEIGRLVFREAALMALAGTAIGTAAAWLLARAMASLQYGVSISDPFNWAGVVCLLAFTTLAASWRPAREARRVDPVLLLRGE